MIRRIENYNEIKPLKLRESHYSRALLSHLKAYGTDFDFCELYEIYTKSTAGYIVFFNASMVADFTDKKLITHAVVREVAEFIAFKCPATVELPKELCPKTGLIRGYTRHKRFFFDVPIGNNSVHIFDNPNMDDVYDTVYGTEQNTEFGLWLTDTARSRNRGQLRLYSLQSSVLTVRFMSDGYAYITDVATPPSDRGKGQARMLLAEVSFAMSAEGYKCYLTAREKTADYYRSLNYPEKGNDYIYEIKGSVNNEQFI